MVSQLRIAYETSMPLHVLARAAEDEGKSLFSVIECQSRLLDAGGDPRLSDENRRVATNGALIEAERLELDILRRHHTGDWGCVCQEDRDANTLALVDGSRILSAYIVKGARFYVITESTREVTTVLLADEY
jgi:hypothetical protein